MFKSRIGASVFLQFESAYIKKKFLSQTYGLIKVNIVSHIKIVGTHLTGYLKFNYFLFFYKNEYFLTLR